MNVHSPEAQKKNVFEKIMPDEDLIGRNFASNSYKTFLEIPFQHAGIVWHVWPKITSLFRIFGPHKVE